ncbi:MAG: hypothetical protein ACE5HC_10675 [Candidatus Binatia bacterium]
MEPKSHKPQLNAGSLLLLLALSIIALNDQAEAGRVTGTQLVAQLELSPPVVLHPSLIRWLLSERGTGRQVASHLTLAITQLEGQKRVFFLNQIPVKGEFTFNFQFTDASAYRITAVAEAEGEMIRKDTTVNVKGVQPPREAFVVPLLCFLAVIALGLVSGKASRLRSVHPTRR